MQDRSADQPDSRLGGSTPQGTASNAAGASGIVAIGQILDDPWRVFVSVAGPWLVVAWRWVFPILKAALQLLGLALLKKRLGQDLRDDHRNQIEEKIQRVRLAVIEELTRRIGGDTNG